jgi:hypothetical protein
MGTIANLQYKFCAWEHNAEELFLSSKLFDPFSSTFNLSCFSFDHVSGCYDGRVCVGRVVSKHFIGLEKIVLKNVESVFNIRISTYNSAGYNITIFNRFLLLCSSLAVLFGYLLLYIYNLLSFITNYFLAFLVFKGFYFSFLVFIFCILYECRSSLHEFNHENSIGGV